MGGLERALVGLYRQYRLAGGRNLCLGGGLLTLGRGSTIYGFSRQGKAEGLLKYFGAGAFLPAKEPR